MMNRIVLPAPACPVIMDLHVVKVGIHDVHTAYFQLNLNCSVSFS